MTHPDDLLEAYDADIPRADLVKTSANGSTFLLMKSGEGAGLMAAEDVRDLIKGASPVIPTPRDVFPPKETAVTETATEQVAKAGDDPTDDLDPTTVLAEPEGDAPGDPNDPGSPAWEAIDAATATKWTAILSRAKNAIECMSDREAQEAVTGDPGDADSVYDLTDACCAIDYAIQILAPFAVGEQIESDLAAEAIDMVLKTAATAAAIKTTDLDVIEGIGPFRKAGKVLSAANESQIRTAVESLQNVLSSLPQAEEAPVTKTAVIDPPEAPAAPVAEPVVEPEAAPVVKAKGDPQMAVFDANGNLVGTCDPGDLSPIAAPTPPEGGDAQGADAPAADPEPVAEPAPAPEPEASADAPVTIPGTDTVQSPPDDDEEPVAKGAASLAVADVVSAFGQALREVGINEAVIKAADANLVERLERLEAQPASGGPLLNGGTGSPGAATRDDSSTDALAPLRKAAEDETDPAKKAALNYQLGVELVKAGRTSPVSVKPQTWDDVLKRFNTP